MTDLLFSKKYERNKDMIFAIDIPDDNTIKPPLGYDFSDSTIKCVILDHYSLFILIIKIFIKYFLIT